MAPTVPDARTRFLDQAADTLAVTAPVVSSYIRATKRSAEPSQDLQSAAFENVCNACGQALLVGWSCEPVRSAEHKRTRQQRISGNDPITKCVRCSACGNESMITRSKKPKTAKSTNPSQVTDAPVPLPARKKNDTPTPLPDLVPMPVPAPKEKTPEPPQAKPAARRKARGKNASLQALLANKKPVAPKSSGYGLDFMDFMK